MGSSPICATTSFRCSGRWGGVGGPEQRTASPTRGPWYGSGRTYVAATRRWRKGSKEACCGATFAVRNFKEQTHDPGAPLARRRACAETRDGAVVARQGHDLEVGVFDSPFRNQIRRRRRRTGDTSPTPQGGSSTTQARKGADHVEDGCNSVACRSSIDGTRRILVHRGRNASSARGR